MVNTFKEYLSLSEAFVMNGKTYRSILDGLSDLYRSDSSPDRLGVHFSDINKVGINPKNIYSTPAGIYFYPLEEIIRKKLDVAWGAKRNYLHIIRLLPSANILKMLPSDSVEDQKGKEYIEEKKWQYAKMYSYKIKSDYSIFWEFTQQKANGNPAQWNHIFRQLKIDGFVDMGTGTIHENERVQGVVFSTKNIEQVLTIDNRFNKTSPKNLAVVPDLPKMQSKPHFTEPVQALPEPVTLAPTNSLDVW